MATPSPEAGRPLVSIGVPVYNGSKFLRESLDSIAAQTYQNIEVVVSDNASTDQTPDICAEFAVRDRRFRHVRLAENIGGVPNHNHVFSLTRGKYFMWGSHDDMFAPSYVCPLRRMPGRRPGGGARVRENDHHRRSGQGHEADGGEPSRERAARLPSASANSRASIRYSRRRTPDAQGRDGEHQAAHRAPRQRSHTARGAGAAWPLRPDSRSTCSSGAFTPIDRSARTPPSRSGISGFARP